MDKVDALKLASILAVLASIGYAVHQYQWAQEAHTVFGSVESVESTGAGMQRTSVASISVYSGGHTLRFRERFGFKGRQYRQGETVAFLVDSSDPTVVALESDLWMGPTAAIAISMACLLAIFQTAHRHGW